MQGEKEYLDYRAKKHTTEIGSRALKLGLLLSSFCAMALGLSFVGGSIFDVIVFAVLSGVIVTFGAWTIAYLSAQESIDFIQGLYREHEEAMKRV